MTDVIHQCYIQNMTVRPISIMLDNWSFKIKIVRLLELFNRWLLAVLLQKWMTTSCTPTGLNTTCMLIACSTPTDMNDHTMHADCLQYSYRTERMNATCMVIACSTAAGLNKTRTLQQYCKLYADGNIFITLWSFKLSITRTRDNCFI